MNSRLRFPLILVAVILIIDQVLKIWVKTNMQLDSGYSIFGDWAYLRYTENPGMAFGYRFGGEIGKLILTLFRIVAVVGITWYLFDIAKKHSPKGLLISFALILAGAIGNIIDSTFYGMLFDSGMTFNPDLGEAGAWQGYKGISQLNFEGYAPVFKGCVVDMFYFPIIDTRLPDWFPFWGGENFVFFRPIFNVADSAITVGVASILIFHRKFFKQAATKDKTIEATN